MTRRRREATTRSARGTHRRAPTAAPRSGPFVVRPRRPRMAGGWVPCEAPAPRVVPLRMLYVVESAGTEPWTTAVTASRRRRDGTLDGGGRRPAAVAVEPGQGALPGRLHQGRGRRLLRPDRAGPAAAHRRPADVLPAVPRRGRREGVLRQERAAGDARLGAHRAAPAPGSSMDRETLDYVVIDDLPTLVWAANLAAHRDARPAVDRRPARRRPRARPAGARPGPRGARHRRRSAPRSPCCCASWSRPTGSRRW